MHWQQSKNIDYCNLEWKNSLTSLLDGHIEENYLKEHCEERRNDMNDGETIVGKGVEINGEPNGIIVIKW